MLKIIQFVSGTEFSRYFWAGSLTFLVDFLILLVLTELFGINYLWSNLISVSAGLLLSYALCVNWVFLYRRYNRVVFEFPIFFLSSIVGLGLNEFLMWVIVSIVGIHYLAAKIVVTFLVFVVNFSIKKIVLFRK